MFLALMGEFRASSKRGVNICKQKLGEASGMTFKELDAQRRANAQFSRCTVAGRDAYVYMYCETCCKLGSGLYCLDCFDHSDHEGHRVSVHCNNQSCCDCGDRHGIDKCNWCEKHKNVGSCEIPSEIEEDTFLTVIAAAIGFAVEVARRNKRFLRALDFVMSLTSWGSFYTDAITRYLFNGGWGVSPFSKILFDCHMIPMNCQRFEAFCYKLVTSKDFAGGYAHHFAPFFARCAQLVAKEFVERSVLCPEYLHFLPLATRSLRNSKLMEQLEEEEGIIEDVMGSFAKLFKTDGDDKIHWVNCLCSKIPLFMQEFWNVFMFMFDLPWIMHQMIRGKGRTDFFAHFADFLFYNNELPDIVRATGDKEDDTDLYVICRQHYLNIWDMCWLVIMHVSLLSTDITKEMQLKNIVQLKPRPLTKVDEKTLVDIIGVMLKRMLPLMVTVPIRGTFFGKPLPIIDPWTDTFSFYHPLNDVWATTVVISCVRNSIDVKSMLEMLSVDDLELLDVSALVWSELAGRAQVRHDLFHRNDDSLHEATERRCLKVRTSLYVLQMVLAACEHPGDVIAQAATAFGVDRWRDINPADMQDCGNWTSVITNFLRYLIQIISLNNYESFLGDKQLDFHAHLLFLGRISRKELTEQSGLTNIELTECLQEIGNSVSDHHGTIFTLKPDYFDKVSVFFDLYSEDEFTRKLSEETENGKGKLLNLLPINLPTVLQGAERFLFTDELRLVLKAILETANECPNKSSVPLTLTAFSLFRLILRRARDKRVVEENYSSLLLKLVRACKNIKHGLQMLRNFHDEISQDYPGLSQMVQKNIHDELDAMRKNRRPNLQEIMQKFNQAQQAFADRNRQELETIETPVVVRCIFCEEPIETKTQGHGYLIHLDKTNLLTFAEKLIANDSYMRYPVACKIRMCGHIAHRACLDRGPNAPVGAAQAICMKCPLDRTHANSMIPIFGGSRSTAEEYHAAGQLLADQVLDFCSLSLAQCLAYNIALLEILSRTEPSSLDDSLNTTGLIHLAQYLLRARDRDDVAPDGTVDPFWRLTRKLFMKATRETYRDVFSKLLDKYWKRTWTLYNEASHEMSVFNVFARRVYLLDRICRKDCSHLEYPSLEDFCTRHNLSLENPKAPAPNRHTSKISWLSPMKPFAFCGLRPTFTDFFKEDRLKTGLLQGISFAQCLLCGKLCYIPKPGPKRDGLDDFHDVTQHVRHCAKYGPVPILHLTGVLASAVHVVDNHFHVLYDYDSLYTDQFNTSDIGLQCGFVLTLNERRVHDLICMLFNGEITRRMESGQDREPDEQYYGIDTLTNLINYIYDPHGQALLPRRWQ